MSASGHAQRHSSNLHMEKSGILLKLYMSTFSANEEILKTRKMNSSSFLLSNWVTEYGTLTKNFQARVWICLNGNKMEQEEYNANQDMLTKYK